MWFPEGIRSSYDNIAGMYDAFWGDWYFPAALPALQNLFFSEVPPGTHVLDLCCGSGHVAREFVARGYRVTGIERSSELIRIARRRLPKASFQQADVCHFTSRTKFAAAYSTFDSLNHLLQLSELESAFRSIHHALQAGAIFVFDMNLEEAYFADSRQWAAMVQPSDVGLVRGLYDRATKVARTELIWFTKTRLQRYWRAKRSVVEERCYTKDEILNALYKAGFTCDVSSWADDLGVTADLGYGRMFFRCRK